MPVVRMTLSDINQSVMRPIVFDIINQIQDITKIDKSTKIFWPGDTNKMQQNGSSIDNQNRDALFSNNQSLLIEVEEDYDPDSLSTTAVNYREFEEIFRDGRLSLKISPIYVDSTVTIHFKYKSKSKNEAQRWRDDLRVQLSAMRDINLHDLTYHFLIPDPFLMLMKKIHELRESVGGYNENFEEWVSANATNRLTVISDLTNKENKLSVSETQTRVQGIYDFSAVPEKPERDDNTGNWIISLSYKFTYNRPAACEIRYPVMVHNQLLPVEYVIFTNKVPNDPTKKNLSFSKSLKAMNFFEQQTTMKRFIDPNFYIKIPEYDDFSFGTPPPFTGTIFCALCETDLETQKELFNLNDLGDVILDQDILDFIAVSEAPYITRLYESIFNIALYRGNFLAGNDALSCDQNLNVRTNHVQNLRIVHHARFSIITDLTVLKESALERLRNYPKVLIKVIQCINESLANNPALKNMSGKRFVTLDDFNKLLKFYNMANLNKHGFTSRKTLQLGSIIAYKDETK